MNALCHTLSSTPAGFDCVHMCVKGNDVANKIEGNGRRWLVSGSSEVSWSLFTIGINMGDPITNGSHSLSELSISRYLHVISLLLMLIII